MSFTIKYYSHGILRVTHKDIPAYKHDNMLRIPDFTALVPLFSSRVIEALQRSEWRIVYSDMLQADLYDRKGNPIGSLTANWSN